MVKTLEHGYNGEATDLNMFDDLFPHRLGVNDEFISNTVLDLRLMPVFMVEHFVVALNPNGPKLTNLLPLKNSGH